MKMKLYGVLISASFLLSASLHAQSTSVYSWDPLFLGYGSHPEMDYTGRTVMSLQSGLSRSIGSIRDIGERRPAFAPAWEFPLAAWMLLLQHEVSGHGGRARELGLSPSYEFSFLSAATGTARPPSTNEENTLIAAGGTESDTVMARRVLLDSLGPDGVDGAKLPLYLMSKLDLSIYVLGTEEGPEAGEDFVDQYRDGNDIVYYVISRQADRRGADPAVVWEGTYQADLSDPLLEATWDDAETTALWSMLDPSMIGAMVGYFRQHVVGGEVRVKAPVLRLSEGVGLTVGTRGALGPQEVTRFLDLYATTPRGVFSAYVRDLDSSVDRTYGLGAGVHGLRLRPNLELGFGADVWEEPDSLERLRDGNGWNATVELDALLSDRWGVAAKVGAKSEGFFPGLPLEDGPYFGFGVLAVW